MSTRLLGLACMVMVLPAMVIATPRPRPIDWVEHRISKRHKPANDPPPPIAFKSHRSDDGFVLHKLHGPETIQLLLGAEMKGDFVADIDVEIAGFRELGIRPHGGTPVPYYGFRSSDGQKEALYFLSTYTGGWHAHSIQLRRQNGILTAQLDRMKQNGFHQPIKDKGFVCFVMNDTSKLRIRHCSVTAVP